MHLISSQTLFKFIITVLLPPSICFFSGIRMEKINMRSLHTQAKIVGTLVTVAGALLMILYKGPVVEFVWTKGRSHHNIASTASQDESHWLMGTISILFSCFSWASFFILQVSAPSLMRILLKVSFSETMKSLLLMCLSL